MIVPLALLAFTLQPQPPIDNPCVNGYIENVWDPRFTPGQRWTYRNRPADQGSTLIITKIDDVPEIGVVIQIKVEKVDLGDDRAVTSPRGHITAGYAVDIAIRRDSLDASALEPIGITQIAGNPSNYSAWKKNCKGRTYAITVDEAMQTEHFAYLARQSELTVPFAAVRINTGRHQNMKMTLTVLPKTSALLGSLTSKEGTPIKDAVIEVQIREVIRAGNLPGIPGTAKPIEVKTGADGSFELPPLPPVGIYTLKLNIDDFKPLTGTLNQSSSSSRVSFSIHSED